MNHSADVEKKIEFSCEELKAKLYGAVQKLLKAGDSSNDNIDENKIFVSIKESNDKTTITGSVLCTFCERNDVNKKISVYCKRIGDACYWILGNYSKHLRTKHKVKRVHSSKEGVIK